VFIKDANWRKPIIIVNNGSLLSVEENPLPEPVN
jgi:hypothetical protein